MNDYYQKYIKYKTKYFEIKYGGSGSGKVKKVPPHKLAVQPAPKSGSVQSLSPQLTPPPSPKTLTLYASSAPSSAPSSTQSSAPSSAPSSTQSSAPSPIPLTPIQYTRLQDDPTSAFSTVTGPSTPKFIVNPASIDDLITNKDDLLEILRTCIDPSAFIITAREQKKVKRQFYINFEKEGKQYAHFSFHFPDESKEAMDVFEVDTLHLKLDIHKNIVFNLVNIIVLSIKQKGGPY